MFKCVFFSVIKHLYLNVVSRHLLWANYPARITFTHTQQSDPINNIRYICSAFNSIVDPKETWPAQHVGATLQTTSVLVSPIREAARLWQQQRWRAIRGIHPSLPPSLQPTIQHYWGRLLSLTVSEASAGASHLNINNASVVHPHIKWKKKQSRGDKTG